MAKNIENRIESVQEQIRQLENRRKLLLQQQRQAERKARTKRLIERGAILESLIDGAGLLTNEQIKNLLTAALHSEAVRDVLSSMQEQETVLSALEPHDSEPATGLGSERRAGA